MVSDSRSSRRRAKDDESSNSKRKQSGDKGLSTSSSAASDTNGLRRSSRETLSAKKGEVAASASHSPIRKSMRLEKQLPKTPPPEGKVSNPSPLRRSDRGKILLSVSSKSKKVNKSPSSGANKGMKKEKSMTQLSLETEEVSRSEEEKKRDKRSSAKYKALFQKSAKKKLKTAGPDKKKEKEDKLSPGDSNNCRGEIDGIVQDAQGASKRKTVALDSGFWTPGKEAVEVSLGGKAASSSSMKPGHKKASSEVEDDPVLGTSVIPCSASPISVDAMRRITNVELEKLPVDCSAVEKEKELELVASLDGGESEDQIGPKSGQEIISSSRKRIMLDMDSDTSGANEIKKICITNTNCTLSFSSEGARSSPVEKCGGSFEGQSIDIDSTREGLSSCNSNLRQELVTPSSNKQKESPSDLQTVRDLYTCFTCKRGGLLLCCEGRGCKRSYHLLCLDPPMDEVPLGVWYCLMCVKKKLESGVYSVSEGVESIWDVKEVSILDVDGLRKEREFFVKYKGLAHIHNRWVPESKLLVDAPSLVAKFDRKSQVVSWKQEWTLPHRLLQKRLLMSAKPSDLLDPRYEWLVKWRGLDYEHATWELDNASIFESPEGRLIKDFENRRKRMNVAASSKVDKILGSGNCSSDKLSQQQCENSSGSDNLQGYINKLHKFWRKSPNAVIIDEQANERIMKIISLVQSFQSNTCGPFLIISTSAALHSWDVEFLQLAPCLNVVVYSGDKNLRKSIRKLEFYEEGCIIFEVLITTLEFVLEDLDVLGGVQWELIIYDEPLRTRISSDCSQLKRLDSKRKLVIVSYQMKTATDYSVLLSLLEAFHYSPNSDSLLTSTNDSIIKLNEKLSKYVVWRWKSDSLRFKEYWVPIQMSNLQVEQYCATLISNSGILCSSHKNDPAEVVREVLIPCRQCCDHPYIANKNTPDLLSKDLHVSEYLGFGIKAGGKFQFLDAILTEMKKQGLRALILYQEFKKDSIGDYLDDFLRQRFGPDSYERVVASGAGVHVSKKQIQIALNKFNKENGRFVFLLETRGCSPSIKLSAVNTVIIFGSDWNPMTEVKALQKITLDPPSEQITVFRMFTAFTLEEKVLCLAKQENFSEINVHSITSLLLLMWGASHQFQTLEKFHRDTVATSSPKVLINNTLSKDSIEEMLQIIASNGRETESRKSPTILNVQRVGGVYRVGSSLPGELENKVIEEGKPHIFWTKLLGGKIFQWKYISGSSQRNRRKVQYFETEAASDAIVRKRRKVGNSVDLPSKEGAVATVSSPRSPASINGSRRANCTPTSSLCNGFLEVPQNYNFDTEERKKLCDAQKSLHLSLKPGISKLCKLLKLTDGAEVFVNEFLDYMLRNHHVSSDSPTTLEAFQISVCWTVASLLKLKIDHKESVRLAKQHLNFNCRNLETEFAFSMLRCFKSIFAYRTGKLTPGFVSSSERAPELRLAENDISKCINQIHKKFEKKLSKLIEKQEEEKNKLMRSYEEDKLQIENRLRMEKSVIYACFKGSDSMRVDKLKLAEVAVTKELEELENKKKTCLKELEAKHLDARRMVQERGARWVGAVKAWARRELFGKTPVSETSHWLEPLANQEVTIEDSSNGGFDNTVSVNPPSPEPQLPNGTIVNAPKEDTQVGDPQMACSSDEVQILASGGGPSSEDRSPDTTALTVAANMTRLNVGEKDIQLGVAEMLVSSDGVQNLVSEDEPSPDNQIADTTSVSVAVDETRLRVPETLSSSDGSVDELACTATMNETDGEIPSSVPESLHHEVEASRNTKENNEVPAGASVGADQQDNEVPAGASVGADQQDRLNTSVNECSHQEASQVDASFVQPAIALNVGDPVPPHQAHQDDPTSSTSGEIQLRDAPQQNAATEVEGLAAQPVDAAPTNQHAHEAVVEPREQVGLLPSSISPSSSNLADVVLVEEIEHCPRTDPASNQVSQPPTDPVVHAPPVSNQPIYPLNAIPIGPNLLGLHRSDLRTMPELYNRSGQLLPVTHTVVAPPCPDPFQKELERLSKEFELASKSHKDMELKLKSDHDKEIEELVAQIDKKYELKQQEVQFNFLAKKKEFEEHKKIVFMNKILAEAFRNKCMEIRSSGKLATQQDPNSSFTQQLVQPSMRQNTPRPALVGVSSSGPPAANVQALAPERTPQATASPRIVTLPLQAIRPSSNVQRSLQVGSISYSSLTQQGGGEVRSQPPHLRKSAPRPVLPPHQRGIPPQPANLPVPTSSTLPSLSIPSQPPTAPNLFRPVDIAPHPQASGESPSFPNLQPTFDLRNGTATSSSAGFPSLADWIPTPTPERPNTSEPSTSSVQVNQGSMGRATNLVYLSDDD